MESLRALSLSIFAFLSWRLASTGSMPLGGGTASTEKLNSKKIKRNIFKGLPHHYLRHRYYKMFVLLNYLSYEHI